MPAVLESALAAWVSVLGPEYVSFQEPERLSAETATFHTEQSVSAILRPADKLQILMCLATANNFGIPLYPISSGKNWGYGSRVPPAGGCALLDLSRLNKIIDFSEDLAYVTVEPGVTQRQLYSFLQSKGSRLWMDVTGSSPDCSLIGNVMERGFGHTPYGDHFAHVCGLEVVLPNGVTLQTGAARFPSANSAAINRWGLGPSLDGLFTQSNLGIVTRMTFWLMPAPASFSAFFFRCEAENGLPALIDALRCLRLSETLRSSIHIANDYKVLGGLRQYPWDAAAGKTPLTPDLMSQFRKDLTFGYWNASGGLYGSPGQVVDAQRQLRKALAAVPGKLKFVTEGMLDLAQRFSRPFKFLTGWDIGRTAELVRPVIGLMRGVPTEQSLGSAYWRKKQGVPSDPDPDRDRCGLLWYAPVSPAQGSKVDDLARMVSALMLAHGFEPLISLTMISPRAVNCVISITYDRDVAGEDQRALTCYRKLEAECTGAGYYPYRLGICSMGAAEVSSPHSQFLRHIRSIIDPNRILAPRRYEV